MCIDHSAPPYIHTVVHITNSNRNLKYDSTPSKKTLFCPKMSYFMHKYDPSLIRQLSVVVWNTIVFKVSAFYFFGGPKLADNLVGNSKLIPAVVVIC